MVGVVALVKRVAAPTVGAIVMVAAITGMVHNVNKGVNPDEHKFALATLEANIDGKYYPLQYSEQDLFYMTQALYFEARSEPVECQQMVASVILNRKYDWHYPNSVKTVIWDYKQFSYTHDGKHELMNMHMEYQIAEEIAHEVLAGLVLDTTEGSLYYHNPNIVNWAYKEDYDFVVGCGDHDFYKRKGAAGWK